MGSSIHPSAPGLVSGGFMVWFVRLMPVIAARLRRVRRVGSSRLVDGFYEFFD